MIGSSGICEFVSRCDKAALVVGLLKSDDATDYKEPTQSMFAYANRRASFSIKRRQVFKACAAGLSDLTMAV